eukprot:gene23099-biopygen5801
MSRSHISEQVAVLLIIQFQVGRQQVPVAAPCSTAYKVMTGRLGRPVARTCTQKSDMHALCPLLQGVCSNSTLDRLSARRGVCTSILSKSIHHWRVAAHGARRGGPSLHCDCDMHVPPRKLS